MTDTLTAASNRPELGATKRYAAIIGERPSHGARSPALWNAVFAAENIDCRFHPFDIAADALGAAIAELRADPRFVGGSVAVPYKSTIIPMLDDVEPVAAQIGAVNALYRKGDAIIGANTDGEGALACLHEALGVTALGDRSILLIGTGGAGLAVAAYIASDLSGNGCLTLASRNTEHNELTAARLGERVEATHFPPTAAQVAGADIVVNCTSLGFDDGSPTERLEAAMTPLGPTDDLVRNLAVSVDAVRASKSTALFYDIVYKPSSSTFLNLARAFGRQAVNGLGMNQRQAAIAFCKAISPGPDAERVRQVMSAVL